MVPDEKPASLSSCVLVYAYVTQICVYSLNFLPYIITYTKFNPRYKPKAVYLYND